MGNYKLIRTSLDSKTSLIKLIDDEHEEYLYEIIIKKIIPKNGGVLDVGGGSDKTRPRICNKCGKPIYIKTRPKVLDGGKENTLCVT